MLSFARAQVGKPFSNAGMARSVVWPRASDYHSFFCAELVAAILKTGGLMSQDSNAGAATPYSLFKLYAKQAAATANPWALRQAGSGLTLQSVVATRPGQRDPQSATTAPLLAGIAAFPPSRERLATGGSARRHSDSPPRASFKLLAAPKASLQHTGITLSLSSLR